MKEKLATLESAPWTGEERFTRMCDLHQRYTTLRDNHAKRVSWETVNKMYERYSYKNKGKAPDDVNFGQFKNKVDGNIGRFEDILTSRQLWCKINTYEGNDDKENAEWSRIISTEFHRYAIHPWVEKYLNIRLAVFDMVMYGKGAEWWCEKSGYMSENIPISTVYPDSNAGSDPKEFNLLFIRKRFYTVGELWMIANDEASDEFGWDKEAVKDLIRFSNPGDNNTDAFTLMERGGHSPDTLDLSIEVVIAYVKEYGENAGITMYIMPESGYIVRDSQGEPKKAETRYLRRVPKYAECFSQILSLRTNITTRSFWNATSTAEQLYASCRLYDKMMNRMIRAVIRNTILFLKSDNVDQQERLANLTAEECQVLSQGDDILQRQIAIDITGSAQVLRQVMFDTDSSMGAKLATGSQNVKGRAVTAAEAEIQQQNAQNEVQTDVKMFMICEHAYIKELYRRFCSMGSDDKNSKMLDKFKKKMKDNAIPDNAWSPDEVVIEPYYNAVNANPEGMARSATTVLTALSRTPQSDGEHRATWDIIAAAVGHQLADYYLPERDYVDSDTWKAGMENEAMSNPDVFQKNVMVMPRDNHFIHMTFHLADAMHSIEICGQKFQMLQQTIEESKPVVLHDISTMVISLDMKMAHMEAHIAMYSRSIQVDGRAKQAIEAFKSQMQQIRLREQAIENQLGKEMQARIQQNRQDLGMTIDLQFKQAMHEEDLRFAKAMHDVKLGANVEKATLLHDVAEQKAQQKLQSQVITDQAKAIRDRQGVEAQRASSAMDLAKQSIELQQSQQQSEQQTQQSNEQ